MIFKKKLCLVVVEGGGREVLSIYIWCGQIESIIDRGEYGRNETESFGIMCDKSIIWGGISRKSGTNQRYYYMGGYIMCRYSGGL